MANVVKVPNFKANSNGNTHTHTQTRVCAEDACAACGAANVGGKFAYTDASQEENFVVFSGTIWLHQRSQRRRRKAQAKQKANGAMQSRETPTILLIKNAIRAKSEKCKVRTQQRQTLCRVRALLYTLDCTAMFD